MIGWKAIFHIHIVGLGIAFVDVFLEKHKYKKIGKAMDLKVEKMNHEIDNKLFDLWLTEIKTKFLAIKNAFKLVIEGNDACESDDFNLRWSWLDSVFLLCEEV